MKINLPDLDVYRQNYRDKGVAYPLQPVKKDAFGLLGRLPNAMAIKKGWPWTEQVSTAKYNAVTQWPKLTIVTPSFNQGDFLEQTIRSVLLQNYPNFEYIIIDGGSTDESVDIIKKYQPWLSFWQSEKDNGQGHAINKGFSLASGDLFCWINSDDYYLENTFLKVVQTFLRTHSAFVYGYAFNYFADQGRFELVKVLPALDYFIRMPSLAQPSCFWSKKIHQPIWEDLTCALDYELWLRILRGNQRTLIKAPLSVANIHQNAKTSDPKMKEKWLQDHLMICNEEAHGNVWDWNRIVFINRIRVKLYRLISFK